MVRLVFFGHNRKDAAIVRRAHSFMDAGVGVTGFMFRRDGEPALPGPAWRNIDLGMVEHCKHAQRILTLLRAIWRTLSQRGLLREADIIYARNLDMLVLAFVGLIFIRQGRPRIVYECLDVNEAMTKPGSIGTILRWVERIALRRIDLLVVSSPGFMREYFIPTQNYREPYSLLENKIYLSNKTLARPAPEAFLEGVKGPIVIAWVGILRCQETLHLLKQLAESEGEKVLIRFHGVISEFLIPDFTEQIEPFSNIVYEGPYQWPEGLSEAYKGAHFVWAQELSWRGHNSDWLLPNRIYEGSFFGALSLCVDGTETGRVVAERSLGYALADAQPKTLIDFMRSLDRKEIADKQRSLLSRPDSDFIADSNEAKDLVQRVLSPSD
jgi:succinoglycan biosynthesis protein ExoL